MIILFSKGKIMSQYINQFDYKPQEEVSDIQKIVAYLKSCLLYTSPSPRD